MELADPLKLKVTIAKPTKEGPIELRKSPSNSNFSLFQEVSPASLAFQQILPFESDVEHPFYKCIISKGFEPAIFFKLFSPERPNYVPLVDRAFVGDGVAFADVTRRVTQENKESLCMLLDLADECECATVFACVRRDLEDVSGIVRSFLAVGFSLSNIPSLPGYLLLVKQL
jgi:hypothetical protein